MDLIEELGDAFSNLVIKILKTNTHLWLIYPSGMQFNSNGSTSCIVFDNW